MTFLNAESTRQNTEWNNATYNVSKEVVNSSHVEELV